MSFYVIDPDLACVLLRDPAPTPSAPAVSGKEAGTSNQGRLAVFVCALASLAVLSAVVPWS